MTVPVRHRGNAMIVTEVRNSIPGGCGGCPSLPACVWCIVKIKNQNQTWELGKRHASREGRGRERLIRMGANTVTMLQQLGDGRKGRVGQTNKDWFL